jgi:prepilin-type N-terminal cleavage/methylation domain-containing protein
MARKKHACIMHNPAPSPQPPAPKSGFTLVEMLVSMALTLILVYAIAQFYAIVGDAVKDGRSMIEINQQLRAVVERLKSDLDQVTVPIVPWVDEGGAAGYFEIREGLMPGVAGVGQGPASDWDVNGNYIPDVEFDQFDTTVDLNGNGIPDFTEPGVSNLLGDTDDWIGMTIRAGSVPFTGQMLAKPTTNGLIERTLSNTQPPDKLINKPKTGSTSAPYAEVVWWTSFSDTGNGLTGQPNGLWDLGEPRFIHRRQLLIRPDLNIPWGDGPGSYYFKVPVPTQINDPSAVWIYDVFQFCDISMRCEVITPNYAYFVANSLADLCRRENRFMHMNLNSQPTAGGFPFAIDLKPNRAGNLQPNLIPDNQASLNNTVPRHNVANAATQYRWVLFDGGRKGEDVMLSNALSFDVRVYDPDAILRADNATVLPVSSAVSTNPQMFVQNVLQPGDPGYLKALAYPGGTTAPTPYPALGTGAYVDLGYGVGLAGFLSLGTLDTNLKGNSATTYLFRSSPPLIASNLFYQPALGLRDSAGNLIAFSRFANYPSTNPTLNAAQTLLYLNALGFTYDTWTLFYERDGINQDQAAEVALGISQTADEGSDGLDNDGINGVDDAGERETVPPYPYPLRGVQIRIRVLEPNTRQVRQATVEGDFIPE